MSSQMVKMTNGKKIKFSNLAFRYLAGEALTAQEQEDIIRTWYEKNAASKTLANYAHGKNDVINFTDVDYTETNFFLGKRIYTTKNHKHKVIVDGKPVDVFNTMTRKASGGTEYLYSDGSVWFVMGKDGKGTTPEAADVELTPIAGNVTADPLPIPARSATPSAETAPTQEDTAEPTELPTQENNTPSAAFDYDEKSDDLDHQLTLGNKFVFSIDGRGGAPTTAFITRLGSGLYRADISADQNKNYKDESILFLGEQIDSIYYHAIIVSAEAINDRQRVADWIKKGVDGKDLSGVNFSWCDFSRCDLSGVRLSKCNLMGADFSGADLSINPAVRPIFAANSDAMDAEWHCVFAMMSDGAEYAEGLRLGSGY